MIARPASVPARATLVRIENPCVVYSTTNMIAEQVTSPARSADCPLRTPGSRNVAISQAANPRPSSANRPRCHATATTTTTKAMPR